MMEEADQDQGVTVAVQDAHLHTDATIIAVMTQKTPPGTSDGRGSIPKAVTTMYIE